MKVLSAVVIVWLAVLAVGPAFASDPLQECNQIEAKVEAIPTSAGADNGSATIVLTRGDTRGAKFIFCEKNGKVLNEGRFELNQITDLKRGQYLCIISTSECSKKIVFSIN